MSEHTCHCHHCHSETDSCQCEHDIKISNIKNEKNQNITNIYIASDHRGISLKYYLIEMLKNEGYETIDMGTNSTESVDYPDIVKNVAEKMQNDNNARAILICSTGAGMEIAANRYRFLRATRVTNPEEALLDRQHNNTNVITFGADYIEDENALACCFNFLETEFDNSERRCRRLAKIS